MVYTTEGFELVRATLIDDGLDVVLDKFAVPVGRVLDYNTKYSGVDVSFFTTNNTLLSVMKPGYLAFQYLQTF